MPFAEQPELGHKTSRASVGAGWRNNDTFEESRCGPAITICSIRRSGIRRTRRLSWPRSACVTTTASIRRGFERATFANVVSLSPIDSVFHSPSWKINVGMNTIRSGCQLCSNGVMNGGIGAAVESHWLKREVFLPSRKRRRTIAVPMKRTIASAEEEPSVC